MALKKDSLSREQSKLSDADYKSLLRLLGMYPAISKGLPLAIDVHKEQTIPLRPKLFQFALKVHCRRLRYITMVAAKRASRYSLNGERVGWVSRIHRLNAGKRLSDKKRTQGQIRSKRALPAAYQPGTLGHEIARSKTTVETRIVFKKRRSVRIPANG